MAKLELRDICKSYGKIEVLKELSFSVHTGEFVSIIGPSGSGKSTIFQLIGGILNADSGDIYLNDENVAGKRGLISFMPQTPSLFPWRTILENVLLGQEIAGKKDWHRAKTLLSRAGLAGYEYAYPHELSGGMKQRVAFIRSLLSPQEIICLDEPFSALDEFTRLDMQKWLQQLWLTNKRTVILVTHSIEESLFLSDRIIVLSQKPTVVKKEWNVPFPRPRTESLLLTEEFLTWKRIVYQEVRSN